MRCRCGGGGLFRRCTDINRGVSVWRRVVTFEARIQFSDLLFQILLMTAAQGGQDIDTRGNFLTVLFGAGTCLGQSDLRKPAQFNDARFVVDLDVLNPDTATRYIRTQRNTGSPVWLFLKGMWHRVSVSRGRCGANGCVGTANCVPGIGLHPSFCSSRSIEGARPCVS